MKPVTRRKTRLSTVHFFDKFLISRKTFPIICAKVLGIITMNPKQNFEQRKEYDQEGKRIYEGGFKDGNRDG
jgi:hypothetical protein